MEFLKIAEMVAKTKRSKCSIYLDGRKGLMPRSIKLGEKSAAWLGHEIDAVLAARVQGKSNDEIRALVLELMQARQLQPGIVKEEKWALAE